MTPLRGARRHTTTRHPSKRQRRRTPAHMQIENWNFRSHENVADSKHSNVRRASRFHGSTRDTSTEHFLTFGEFSCVGKNSQLSCCALWGAPGLKRCFLFLAWTERSARLADCDNERDAKHANHRTANSPRPRCRAARCSCFPRPRRCAARCSATRRSRFTRPRCCAVRYSWSPRALGGRNQNSSAHPVAFDQRAGANDPADSARFARSIHCVTNDTGTRRVNEESRIAAFICATRRVSAAAAVVASFHRRPRRAARRRPIAE